MSPYKYFNKSGIVSMLIFLTVVLSARMCLPEIQTTAFVKMLSETVLEFVVISQAILTGMLLMVLSIKDDEMHWNGNPKRTKSILDAQDAMDRHMAGYNTPYRHWPLWVDIMLYAVGIILIFSAGKWVIGLLYGFVASIDFYLRYISRHYFPYNEEKYKQYINETGAI